MEIKSPSPSRGKDFFMVKTGKSDQMWRPGKTFLCGNDEFLHDFFYGLDLC